MSNPTTTVWNHVIRGYAGTHTPWKSLEYYNHMVSAMAQPDGFTYSSLLSACARGGLVKEGEQVHAMVLVKGYCSNVFVDTNLINFYARDGGVARARHVFDDMTKRSVVSWNSLLAGYVRCGDFDGARRVFEVMPERNVVSWTTMVAGVSQFSNSEPFWFAPGGSRSSGIIPLWSDPPTLPSSRRCRSAATVSPPTPFPPLLLSPTLLNSFTIFFTVCSYLFTKIEKKKEPFFFFDVEKKDYTAMDILMGDLKKEGRVMDAETFGLVADSLVKLGKEDEALGIFKNLDKYKCHVDEFTVTAIVNALCSKGHAKRAEGVVWHHKDKITRVTPCIYRSLLYGWSVQRNVKEARRIIKEMKSDGVIPDLLCYNTFLRCLCERNLRHNPSGLVPEALNVMMEMRSYKVFPTSISYNILLSCLGKNRRVKESCQILETMKNSGCDADWVSYYLVAKVLFLSGRFGKGKDMVDQMIGKGLVPNHKFYYSLIGILCGVERVNHALELFEKMKRSEMGGYGPVYDVLIPKLCSGGNFEKGRELWDEATGTGITLQCSHDVLDPSITEVYKPKRPEKISHVDSSIVKSPQKVTKFSGKMKMRKKSAATKKKKK
uniref:Uncharacterized protein n=1 Tax=Cajanus cajan TaxID=3821 RepID=A0A151SL24_CAJCA|nr:hypothetical protein KK1_001695 [Cajanus cajan]